VTIYSCHICASCFPPFCGASSAKCLLLWHHFHSDNEDIFLNQLIQFYSNYHVTNLHHITTHSTTCCQQNGDCVVTTELWGHFTICILFPNIMTYENWSCVCEHIPLGQSIMLIPNLCTKFQVPGPISPFHYTHFKDKMGPKNLRIRRDIEYIPSGCP